MIEMQRHDLLADLDTAAEQGSLLVIGGPGSGKTWLLQQFAERHKDKGDVVVFLYAEDHVADSFASLQQSLGITDFVGALRAKTGTGNFLVIDALDALRAETVQRAFRELMATVQRELNAWKVIASIRTFDAAESVQFHQLFPARGGSITHSMPLPARNLLVSPLTSEDMDEAMAQDRRLEPIVRSASPHLRTLLHNPFNLWLAIQLLDADVQVDWFSSVQSDVQLLDRYWSFRVGGHETGARRSDVLMALTRAMVERNSLTISARELPEGSQRDPQVLSDLLRNEVLRRSPTGRVSYAHNILFDFGLSKLLIDESNFLSFLTQTPAHSIFYRPSFAYFLTRLWFYDRALLWKTISPLVEDGEETIGRISVIPALVIYEAAESDDDLLPVLRPSVLTRGTVYVLRAVQACNGLTTHKRQLWIRFLHQLSFTPREAFINEFVALLNQAQESVIDAGESVLIADAARQFLNWMWTASAEAKRPKGEREQLSSIAASRVLPVILNLYGVAPREASEVVVAVLGRLGTEHASTNEAYWLAHGVDSVIQNNPDLAATVYARIFAYEETSQDKTSLGGPVFTMTSTRAQDYSMAYYILGTKFSSFIRRDIRLAARAMVQAINGEVARRQGLTVGKLGTYRIETTLFGTDTRLVSDRSEIWDQGYRSSETTEQFVSTLMSELADRVGKQTITKVEVKAVFRELAAFNSFPVLWKRVLDFVEHNHALLPYVLPLLKSPEVLAALETTVAAGNVVRLAFANARASEDDRREIETAILKVPSLPMAKDIYKDPNHIRNRLLGCIPREHLGSDAAVVVEEALRLSALPENRPFFKIGPVTSGAYTEEDWLRDQGVTPDSEQNRKLLDAQRQLKEFEGKFLNQTPSVEDCVGITEQLRQAFSLTTGTGEADVAVITQVLASVAAVAGKILKNEKLERNSPVVSLCRQIVFVAAKHPHPLPRENADAAFDHAVWGSSPKVEAAQAAMYYAWTFGIDSELRALIVDLARDLAPEVRFQIAAQLGSVYRGDRPFFWELVESWLHRERAPGVLDALTRSLVSPLVVRTDQRRVVEHLAVLSQGIPEVRSADSISQVAVDSLTQLFVYFNDTDADMILWKFEDDAARFHNELSYMVFAASKYIVYQGEGADGIRERARRIFVRVIDSVDRGLHALFDQQAPEDSSENAERSDRFGNLLKVIDSAVFRLYIALDANPQLRRDDGSIPTSADRAAVFQELSEFWDRLAQIGKSDRSRPLAPATLQHLMEIFNAVVSSEPVRVLTLASALLKRPRLGYEFDQMAVGEVVKLTEALLADHREILRVSENAAHLGDIIDVFVRAGWPQATRLVMQLDSAIR